MRKNLYCSLFQLPYNAWQFMICSLHYSVFTSFLCIGRQFSLISSKSFFVQFFHDGQVLLAWFARQLSVTSFSCSALNCCQIVLLGTLVFAFCAWLCCDTSFCCSVVQCYQLDLLDSFILLACFVENLSFHGKFIIDSYASFGMFSDTSFSFGTRHIIIKNVTYIVLYVAGRWNRQIPYTITHVREIFNPHIINEPWAIWQSMDTISY